MSLNKKTTQADRVIEWAFLCISTSLNELGGVDVERMGESFKQSDLGHITLFFKIAFKVPPDELSMSHGSIQDEDVGYGSFSIGDERPESSGVIGERRGQDDSNSRNIIHYRLHDEWLLQLVIKDQTGAYLHRHQAEFLYYNQMISMSLGAVPMVKPGHYTVEILADGFLEHTLDLFIL